MKDLSLSVAAVIGLALLLGLGFHAAYPRVEPSPELAGLFVFVATLLRWALARAWQWWRQRKAAPPGEQRP
jgi:hypothetical protein